MNMLAIVLLAQLAVPMRRTFPVLVFPERGMDDSAAYAGYQTRFFRDAAGNTVQVYIDQRAGRIVHLLADAEDESVGMSPVDGSGHPVAIGWRDSAAEVARDGNRRIFQHHLVAHAARIRLGDFLLGSMRVERDFQYAREHHREFGGNPFVLPEYARLVSALQRIAPAERERHLALLHATSMDQLRGRLRPAITTRRSGGTWVVRIVQPALDARDTLVLEVRTDPRVVDSRVDGRMVVLRARRGRLIPFTLRVVTTGRALTPLTRNEIFSPEFLRFLAAERARTAKDPARAMRARWLEREVRGLELLASHEKVMAGLPNYATYFGRDMLLTALMMRPVWRGQMSEFVIASALRKLAADGTVSHEESIGGQALREAAGEYAAIVDSAARAGRVGRAAEAGSRLARARAVLRAARRVRENYGMIDANFQLPVLAARWITDPGVAPARKVAFLADTVEGTGDTRLGRLLRELGLVARLAEGYVRDPVAANLVSFPMRDSTHWRSASWRDSEAGYAGGRFAMDVNAIWVPHALYSVERIFGELRALGITRDSLARAVSAVSRSGSPLVRYARDSLALRRAVDVWSGAWRHFMVRLAPGEVNARVAARVAAMSQAERVYWESVTQPVRDSLEFLALALDGGGKPIAIANTDPATRIFLDATDPGAARATGSSNAATIRDARLFALSYPTGLLVERVGPVVANDAYAPPPVWHTFERDRYHGPRVVWGREVNLFLLGVSGMISAGGPAGYVSELRGALRAVKGAADSAGFRSELWSYEVKGGRVSAVRYGTGSDVQLWSMSDLVVQYVMDGLREGSPNVVSRSVGCPGLAARVAAHGVLRPVGQSP